MGQIFLMENSLTGLLFLIACCFDSYRMAAVSLFCTAIATLSAYLFRFDSQNIVKGLYGFNAALIGQAMIFYFEVNGLVMVGAIIGSILSACMMEFFIRKKLPPFTFPFISITWILLALLKIGSVTTDRAPGPITDWHQIGFSDFAIPAHAFGQVIFQGHILAGILTVLGIYLESPNSAFYGIIATMVSVAIAYSEGQPETAIRGGLSSFNAVLSGIACAGDRVIDGFYMVIATIVSTYFFIFLLGYKFTTLTFPFVVSLWLVVSLKYLEKLIVKKYNIIFHPNTTLENESTSPLPIKITNDKISNTSNSITTLSRTSSFKNIQNPLSLSRSNSLTIFHTISSPTPQTQSKPIELEVINSFNIDSSSSVEIDIKNNEYLIESTLDSINNNNKTHSRNS
ncbi:urea transport protein [Tieghemostelium lacteum]|uniref:Urea transport protein n=1 Tax=Tieghemostelium lacteum TaxID=361077 RepID=A0A152A8H3_TIELA|nr:urea transport protein [Tieghemostelium lacteum]|eukprot:KYR02377.1 urea transport protein [Tieghemostelium lacteum]